MICCEVCETLVVYVTVRLSLTCCSIVTAGEVVVGEVSVFRPCGSIRIWLMPNKLRERLLMAEFRASANMALDACWANGDPPDCCNWADCCWVWPSASKLMISATGNGGSE